MTIRENSSTLDSKGTRITIKKILPRVFLFFSQSSFQWRRQRETLKIAISEWQGRCEKISRTEKRGERSGEEGTTRTCGGMLSLTSSCRTMTNNTLREKWVQWICPGLVFLRVARKNHRRSGSCDIAPNDLKNNHGSSGAVISNALPCRSPYVHRKILLLIFRTRGTCLIGFSGRITFLYVNLRTLCDDDLRNIILLNQEKFIINRKLL